MDQPVRDKNGFYVKCCSVGTGTPWLRLGLSQPISLHCSIYRCLRQGCHSQYFIISFVTQLGFTEITPSVSTSVTVSAFVFDSPSPYSFPLLGHRSSRASFLWGIVPLGRCRLPQQVCFRLRRPSLGQPPLGKPRPGRMLFWSDTARIGHRTNRG